MQGGILLLSSPKKHIVKDAAHAVGRVGSEKREKVCCVGVCCALSKNFK